MYTQRPRLNLDIDTKEYNDFLKCCSQEILFIYYFEIISFLNSNKKCRTQDISDIKNKVFNVIISKYIQETNLQNPDFLNIKTFILENPIIGQNITSTLTQNQLIDVLGEQDAIIQKLDLKMNFLRKILVNMKYAIIKASSDKIDFDKIFDRLFDEYLEILFSKNDFESIYKDNIKNKIRALMRSFYFGATLFEYYFKDYSNVYQDTQMMA